MPHYSDYAQTFFLVKELAVPKSNVLFSHSSDTYKRVWQQVAGEHMHQGKEFSMCFQGGTFFQQPDLKLAEVT